MKEFLILFVVFYVWHAVGICIGYHRLLSHRTFTCNKFAEYFWVLAGYLAFEGSPIWWATIHRAHHRHADTPLDPHSPRNGFKQALTGWLMHEVYPSHIDPHTQSKDLMQDPIYLFLEQGGVWKRAHNLSFALNFSYRLVLWACFGWVVALASLLAGLAVLQIPLMLNVACHKPRLGYKNYANADDSVNVWWVALLAMGEGWHNNHHACPGSAKSGMRKFEIDVAWLFICLMKKMGLVHRINKVPTHESLIERFGTEASLRERIEEVMRDRMEDAGAVRERIEEVVREHIEGAGSVRERFEEAVREPKPLRLAAETVRK